MEINTRCAGAENSAKNPKIKNILEKFAFYISIFGLFGIFIISLEASLDPGFKDIWEKIKSVREIWLLLGAGGSLSLAHVVMLRTLKQKGYVNLLWLALPVLMMTALEFLFQFQEWRNFP